MKSSALITLCLAVSACTKPSIPDPRFDFPPAPSQLQQPTAPLETIETPENKLVKQPNNCF